MKLYEKTLDKKNIYSGKIISLDIETVLLPNNRKAKREIVKHPGAVAILPINDKNEIFFVKQYRKAIDSELIEVPAGKIEPNENPKECAIRELKEEIGQKANKMTYIGEFFTSPGFSNEIIYLYKAEELAPCQLEKDEDEFIIIEKYEKAKVIEMINDGIITDAKTILAVYLCINN